MSQMYAWADTVNAALGMGPMIGDHTWVTTYAPGTGIPKATLGDYWYCWGNERENAINLVIGQGGADFARRIALPNSKTENVGIRHKLDGVCHQMANRLLRFSFDHHGNPITVHQAKGYQLSKAMYGTYGGELGGKASACLVKWNNLVSSYEKELAGEN